MPLRTECLGVIDDYILCRRLRVRRRVVLVLAIRRCTIVVKLAKSDAGAEQDNLSPGGRRGLGSMGHNLTPMGPIWPSRKIWIIPNGSLSRRPVLGTPARRSKRRAMVSAGAPGLHSLGRRSPDHPCSSAHPLPPEADLAPVAALQSFFPRREQPCPLCRPCLLRQSP